MNTPDNNKINLASPDYWEKIRTQLIKAERGKVEFPDIGVALSGGGSKAAIHAMGVLKGLNEKGILEKTDYLSSVSGGGYASL